MRKAALLPLLLLICTPVQAQDTAESRLREMLRRTTIDLRAAQDSQATLQASLDQEKQKTATLQKQVDDLTAKLAQPAKPSVSDQEVAQLRADLQAAQAKAASLEPGLKQWQDAYQKAAETARAKDADSRAATTRLTEAERQAGVCAAANTKLIGVANDILHLYQTQSFRSILLGSYEPLLGLKKVELENTVQDYEDKIQDQKYRPGRQAASDAPK